MIYIDQCCQLAASHCQFVPSCLILQRRQQPVCRVLLTLPQGRRLKPERPDNLQDGAVTAATGGPPPEEVLQGDHGRHGFCCPQVSPGYDDDTNWSLTVVISTWISLAGSLGLVMPSGGSVSFVYGFILCIICNICLSASVGELASLWPTAGGQYHYAYAMATKKWKKSMVRPTSPLVTL